MHIGLPVHRVRGLCPLPAKRINRYFARYAPLSVAAFPIKRYCSLRTLTTPLAGRIRTFPTLRVLCFSPAAARPYTYF